MAMQLRDVKAERLQQPALLTVEAHVMNPDIPVPVGYVVTTGVRLRQLDSSDPTILVLEVNLDLAHSPTADPAHEQSARLAIYHEDPPSPNFS